MSDHVEAIQKAIDALSLKALGESLVNANLGKVLQALADRKGLPAELGQWEIREAHYETGQRLVPHVVNIAISASHTPLIR